MDDVITSAWNQFLWELCWIPIRDDCTFQGGVLTSVYRVNQLAINVCNTEEITSSM